MFKFLREYFEERRIRKILAAHPFAGAGNNFPIPGVKAGDPGSPYVKKVSVTGLAVGNYVINETNFPGIGAYIPGWVLVVPETAANLTMSTSYNDGSNWIAMSGTGGGWVFVDQANTVRINIASGATNVNLYPMASF